MRISRLIALIIALIPCVLFAAACGENSSGPANLKNVSIGLGYNPDIQFAPFYVAQSKGYYRDAGLNVTFNHGIVPNLIGLLEANKDTFVFASGDELLEAHDKNKDLHTVDVANLFQKYPVSLIVPANSSIKTIADLKGHTIGVPGEFGATYTGLLALLYDAHLSLNDVHVNAIGFNQVSSLMQNRVDAVMGYSNNEPLQLERAGFHVRTFAVSDYQPLISNGIITTNTINQKQGAEVKSFVQATLKGMQDVLKDPQKAVDLSKTFIPGLNTNQALEVLKATLPIYKGAGHIGYNDAATWQSMETFLVDQKIIASVDNLAQFYSNDYV